MIGKDTFNTLIERAKKFKYSSINYINFDDCKSAELLKDSDNLILILDKSKSPARLYFAANEFKPLINIIAGISGKLRLHFVPREFAADIKSIGFVEWAEFLDFWNTGLTKTASHFDSQNDIKYLDEDEIEGASAVSKRCELQSRGFESVQTDCFLAWLRDGAVIVHKKDSVMTGVHKTV